MYRFRLEPVRTHRKYVEEGLQKRLGDCERLLTDERRKLFAFEQAIDRIAEELDKKQSRGISVSESLLYQRFFNRLVKDIDKQKKKVQAVEAEFVRKREDLLHAVKKRKTLDKLREKELSVYNDAVRKSELEFINEMAIGRFSRQMRNQG
jgi:flagellar FliJ protein